ncbi:MAG TPA: response regulator [Caulobacteraceae bacterium]|jgi:CheY-like chemotaxis protein|nr:response regulator [Caulobacteraceae bacterium]
MPASSEPQQPFFHVLQEELRVLFVDDDPILREFALVHLGTDTAEVKTVGDGDEALALLADWPADIVLLDLEMPRVDGFEVLRRLGETQRLRDLPVIVVTGREDIAAIDRAYAAGATSFVSKPLNWRLLSYQIRYVRRAYEAEQRARAAVQAADRRLAELAGQTSRLLSLAIDAKGDLNRSVAADLKSMLEPLSRRPAVAA